MKLWLFTFTQPDRRFASARVAAPTMAVAAAVMGGIVRRPLLGAHNRHPEPGTFLQYFGENKNIAEPCFISAVDATTGKVLVPV